MILIVIYDLGRLKLYAFLCLVMLSKITIRRNHLQCLYSTGLNLNLTSQGAVS